MLEVEPARSFFAAWRAIASPRPPVTLEAWPKFFDDWRRITAPAPAAVAPLPQLDPNQFAAFAAAFSQAYDARWRSGGMTNVWRAAGLRRDELRNCEVLNWILDRNGDHGQGSAILEGLMDYAGGPVTSKHVREMNYRTRLESLPLGDSESRIDLEIDSPAFLVFIEAKIGAGENGDQLPRYVDLVERKAAGRPWRVLYLTVDGRKPQDKDLHDSIRSITWREVAGVLDRCARSRAPQALPNQLIQQFRDHLQSFS